MTNGYVMTLAGSLSGTVGSNNQGHADGLGTLASFNYPIGVAVDFAGALAVVVSGMVDRCACDSRYPADGWLHKQRLAPSTTTPSKHYYFCSRTGIITSCAG